jgi:hypothetical protein
MTSLQVSNETERKKVEAMDGIKTHGDSDDKKP